MSKKAKTNKKNPTFSWLCPAGLCSDSDFHIISLQLGVPRSFCIADFPVSKSPRQILFPLPEKGDRTILAGFSPVPTVSHAELTGGRMPQMGTATADIWVGVPRTGVFDLFPYGSQTKSGLYMLNAQGGEKKSRFRDTCKSYSAPISVSGKFYWKTATPAHLHLSHGCFVCKREWSGSHGRNQGRP